MEMIVVVVLKKVLFRLFVCLTLLSREEKLVCGVISRSGPIPCHSSRTITSLALRGKPPNEHENRYH
jgi:hypothetical protein